MGSKPHAPPISRAYAQNKRKISFLIPNVAVPEPTVHDGRFQSTWDVRRRDGFVLGGSDIVNQRLALVSPIEIFRFFRQVLKITNFDSKLLQAG